MADNKKQPKKKKQKGRWQLYAVSGGKAERKNKTCPKCGPGFFLAEHKDRITCGGCGYMEKKK